MKTFLRRDHILVYIQNGYGVDEIVERMVHDCCTLVGAVITLGAAFREPGVIEYHGGNIRLEDTSVSRDLLALFEEVGISARISPDIRKDGFQKLMINCVINPLSAILGVRNSSLASPFLDPIKSDLLSEIRSAFEKEGITASLDLETLNQYMRNSANFSSMFQDIRNGRSTEIAFLNGAILEMGDRHGMTLPLNRMIYHLIRFMESEGLHGPRDVSRLKWGSMTNG